MPQISGKDIDSKPEQQLPVLDLGGGQMVQLHEGSSGQLRRAVDVCFVFDTTGSMSDKIGGLISCMTDLVDALGGLALDWRVTTVPFGDLTVPGDRIVADLPFVSDVHHAQQQLRSMPRFSGGANDGESAVEAMLAATRLSYKQEAVKVVVLITDEPALGHSQGAQLVDSALDRLDAACFTVAPDTPYYRAWAVQHGGDWRLVSAAVETGSILKLFKSLFARVVEVTDSVHRLGGGSVRAYLDRGTEPS